jgi:hypothetical protein
MCSPVTASFSTASGLSGIGVVQKMFSTRIQRVGAFPLTQIAKPSRRLSLFSTRINAWLCRGCQIPTRSRTAPPEDRGSNRQPWLPALKSALFPQQHIAWHAAVPALPKDWLGCTINVPDVASISETKLPITKGADLDESSPEALSLLLAMGVKHQGGNAACVNNGTMEIFKGGATKRAAAVGAGSRTSDHRSGSAGARHTGLKWSVANVVSPV